VPSSRPRQARSDVTRQKLLDAAIACLVDLGYARTSTTAVCERAGVSRGAQLHHFPSKDELLLAAVEQLARLRFRELARDAEQRFTQQASASLDGRIVAGVAMLWQTFSGPHFVAAMELWQASRLEPELKAMLYEVERAQMREVRALCEQLFPDEVTSLPDYWTKLTTVTYLMRGLALTRLLKSDEAEVQRISALCVAILHPDRDVLQQTQAAQAAGLKSASASLA
jgi:AcrR family transcriptional regulator